MTRLTALEREIFDAIIVGGGMAGAGVARELALRGLSCVLIEKGDFASGTTSRSSKLIHGGLRYLELRDFALVRESLRERETLARLAPHLVRPLPFLVPVYQGGTRNLIKVRIGLRLYDLLTPGKRTERYRTLGRAEALAMEPTLRPQDLLGAGYYFDDLLLSPERLCLENVLAARRAGAHALNYAQAEEFRPRPGGGWAVRVRDLVGSDVLTVTGRMLVNATGPWVDRVRELAGIWEKGTRLVRTTKGAHLVLPRLTDRAVYLSTHDDRMVFVIPWRDFSLVGTTDTDFDDSPDRVWATPDDVAYLLAETRRVLPDPRVTEANIVYTYAGIRPLTYEVGKRASAVSRQHRVIAEGPDEGFLSITGTKLTCFRSLAQRVGDEIARRLGKGGASRTARLALDGSDEEAGALEVRAWLDVTEAVRASGLEPGQVEALTATYGRRASAVLDLARRLPGGTERLCKSAPDIVAQLHWAVETELTVSLQDFLLRRTGIGTGPCLGLDCAAGVAQRMGALLGWSPRRIEAELNAYHAVVRQGLRFRQ
ncbi:MAG TPA: glycerol-3-phosphate dehydrogenase/oxidase [Methylomirabilota bacterium]|jgi:glycerol-3-phosphate dehydrogenase|nr:glycerol-3-phosphate dehydrogenase/oxidase [Methylomirabilota bacterium]